MSARKLFKLRGLSYAQLVSIFSVCLLAITTLAMVPLFVNYSTSRIFAYTSKEEYEASRWIASNTPVESYILTDPSSGFIVRGIALRNASTYFVLPDGRMPSDSSQLFIDLTLRLHLFFSGEPLSESLDFLQTLPFQTMYAVVTSRTVQWVSLTPDAFLYQPVEGADYAPMSLRFSSFGFVELYESDSVLIYKVVT